MVRGRTKALGGIAAMVLAIVGWTGVANAFIFVVSAPSFPSTVAVGDTFPAQLGIQNASTPPESTATPALNPTAINLVPACGTNAPAPDCTGAVETGVFSLSATGVGTGPASCTGTWTIAEISPGVFRFTPPGGEGSLVLATGDTCVVNFTATALRVPTTDVAPATPGVQTTQLACQTPVSTAPAQTFPRQCSTDQTTVNRGTPTLATQASTNSGTVAPGTAVTDLATVTPPAGAAAPTGTVTYTLTGPNPNATCTTPVVGTPSTVAVGQPSPAYTPTAAGTYNFVATYSGDANYNPITTPVGCGDPAERFAVAQGSPTLTTTATPPASLGGTSSDNATLSAPGGGAGPAPTGTVTFRLFAPNNPTCDTAGPVHSTATVPVDHFGGATYTSGASSPITTPGTYHWTATYSGDANYNGVGPTACNDAAETFTAAKAAPTITTTASSPSGGTTTSSDSATLAAPAGVTVPPAPAPTGTIIFRLFGPANPTCDLAGGVHSTSTVPVDHFGAPAYASAASNPIATPGTYHWTAAYSGDANYAPAGPTACNDPAETFTVASGSLTVTKQAPADAQAVVFTFDIACNNRTVHERAITGSGTSTPVTDLPAGTSCVVAERHVDGFNDQTDQIAPAISGGGTSNVTFTNTRVGTPPATPTTGADLSILASTANPLVAGQSGSVFFTVNNHGPQPTSEGTIIVTIGLPGGVSFVSGGGGGFTCAQTGPSTVTCTRTASLAPGAFTQGNIVVLIDPAAQQGTFTFAVVDPRVTDPVAANNNTALAITYVPAATVGPFIPVTGAPVFVTSFGGFATAPGFGTSPFFTSAAPSAFLPIPGIAGGALGSFAPITTAPSAAPQQQQQQQQQSVTVAPASSAGGAPVAAAAPATAVARQPAFTGAPTRTLTRLALVLLLLGAAAYYGAQRMVPEDAT